MRARAFLFVKSMSPIKYDTNKTCWHLIPFDALEPVAKVLEFGAQKYSPWNWCENKGFSWTRVFSATLRHLFSWVKGEDLDSETNLPHLAHAVCNLLFLLHYSQNRETFTLDDRMKNEPL